VDINSLRTIADLMCCALWQFPNQVTCSLTLSEAQVRIYCYASDGGSDQQFFKKLRTCHQVVACTINELEVFSSCYCHVDQLIFKSGLKLADDWMSDQNSDHFTGFKYFATLAKLCHIWRDYCRKFFVCWCRLYGAAVGMAAAKKVPPKCVAGRWGSISSVEDRIMARLDQLRVVVQAVLGPLVPNEVALVW
jgi:hypothetical protein